MRADVDLGRIRQERMRINSFGDCALQEREKVARFRTVDFVLDAPRASVAARSRRRTLSLRAVGSGQAARQLLRGLQHPDPGPGASGCSRAGTERAIIGVSGGLDSTQALIVTCRAMDQLGLPRKNVLAYTLPGFAHVGQDAQATPGG